MTSAVPTALASSAGEVTIVAKFFKRWLISSLVLVALASGVDAGMPLHPEETGRMKCCDKAAGELQRWSASLARLCRVLNCSGPAPLASGFSANLAASQAPCAFSSPRPGRSVTVAGTIKRLGAFPGRSSLPRPAHPRYIQHHCLLI